MYLSTQNTVSHLFAHTENPGTAVNIAVHRVGVDRKIEKNKSYTGLKYCSIEVL